MHVNHQGRFHQLLICTLRKFPRFSDYDVKDVTTMSPTANKVPPPIAEIFRELVNVSRISTDESDEPM